MRTAARHLTLALALTTLAACSGGDEQAGDLPDAPPKVETAPAKSPSETTPEAPASEDDGAPASSAPTTSAQESPTDEPAATSPGSVTASPTDSGPAGDQGASPSSAPASSATSSSPTSSSAPKSPAPSSPTAEDPLAGYERVSFLMESENVGCDITAEGVSCEIDVTEYSAAQEPDCVGELSVSGNDRPTWNCGGHALGHGRTNDGGEWVDVLPVGKTKVIKGEVYSILPWGDSLTFKGTTCHSKDTGVECTREASGHGFRLAKKDYDLW
ncbi:hypothetical protein ACFFHC_08895 [Kytococcus schroeteri]|uniref:hypothetical protein n=1 Tax=Kytococcus schroeteri TaxID=138300 RepID=UPI0035EA5771